MEDLFSPEFWANVAERQCYGQRKGQAVYNTAHDCYPEQTRMLAGSYVDPFYNDKYISAFLDALANMLTEPS